MWKHYLYRVVNSRESKRFKWLSGFQKTSKTWLYKYEQLHIFILLLPFDELIIMLHNP